MDEPLYTSQLNWAEPRDEIFPDMGPFDWNLAELGIPIEPLRANASVRTTYYIYVNPDDTYFALVTIKAASGSGSLTYQLKSDCDSVAQAQALAQSDWISGKRP